MKIQIYALHLGFGGVENYVSTLANLLCDNNDVEIVSTYKLLDQPAFPINSRVKITYLLENDIPNQVALKIALSKKKYFAFLGECICASRTLFRKYFRNIKYIKQSDVDIIISTRIFHNRLIQRYARNSIVKITGEHNHPHGNENYINQVIKSIKNFDYFIPISRQLCLLYEPYLKNSNIDIRYIPFCIGEAPDITDVKKNVFQLINVGRLSPEKDPLKLVDLMDFLVSKDKRYVMHIFGDGVLAHDLENEIKKKSLDANIIMHGYQTKDIIYPYYMESLAYVMPSRTESFGLVLLEAMSCGTACVAFDSAEGANEIISDTQDGYLIKNRDVRDMASKIINMSNNIDLLNQMGCNARKKAMQYDVNACKQAWDSLITEIKLKRR